jgi:hypothetical protein
VRFFYAYIDIKEHGFLAEDLPPVFTEFDHLTARILAGWVGRLPCTLEQFEQVAHRAQTVLNIQHILKVQLEQDYA